MRTKLVPIGNSRGVRLPKPVIEEARLENEVELTVRGHTVVISAIRNPREGWEAAARKLHAEGGDGNLLEPIRNDFDEHWTW